MTAASDRLIRLLLVEDHEVVRQGIGALLREQPDFQIIGGTGDGNEAVQLAEALRPDVVLMDVTLDGMGGIEATARLRKSRPEVKVIVLSMHDDAPTMEQAFRAGARGYVIKGGGIERLCEAIRAVERGEQFFGPDVSEAVVQSWGQSEVKARSPLSEREREILALIAEGHTGRQIAERLGLKPKTVDNHRTRIMEKLNIHSTAGLVRYALRAGLA